MLQSCSLPSEEKNRIKEDIISLFSHFSHNNKMAPLPLFEFIKINSSNNFEKYLINKLKGQNFESYYNIVGSRKVISVRFNSQFMIFSWNRCEMHTFSQICEN